MLMDVATSMVEDRKLEVIDVIDLPARSERRELLPDAIRNGPLQDYVTAHVATDGTVWLHQSRALDGLIRGENVVVGTGTASGKSLIFQLYALHTLLNDAESKILVFYPLKALAADQLERWKAIVRNAGMPAHTVARIDGDVPTGERQELLDRARIVLMTPDACQAWMMRGVGGAPIRRFLANLSVLVLDEAHVYESVFGSNVAFLLRRLFVARRRIGGERSLRVIATTATIAYPQEHLNALTGLDFLLVDEEENGAPTHVRQIIHVNGPETGATGEAALVDLITGAMSLSPSERGRLIAFHDSRQGIERVVRDLKSTRILPYRSGYESDDRSRIERALRTGGLDAVVATSALELGIDIADMRIGANLGVPQSRKAFRQRIGRIGRATSGVFFVIAGPNAFRKFGETFKEYYSSSVEPSYLYLGNRFIQFAHARCLIDESEVLGVERVRQLTSGWPKGFDQIVQYAASGASRPREFDLIAQLGGDSPHINYPLRQVGEPSYDLKERMDGPARLGSIAANQAIREAFPGATYLHLGRAYKVSQWFSRSFERAIKIYAATHPAPTKPILRKTVNLSLMPDGIVDGHVLRCKNGLVSEAHLQVTEAVDGYSVAGRRMLYRDLRAQDPNLTRKQRDFRTTGIILRIQEPWFQGGGGAAAANRAAVADGLKEILGRERSIAPQDIDATSTNIALLGETGPQRLTDAVVIYDAVYGGLRLTEDLYHEFERYIEQLCRAADLAGDDALVSAELADQLRDWGSCLQNASPDAELQVEIPDGWLQIYKPGSFVCVLYHGTLIEREIVSPQIISFGGKDTLVYAYENPEGLAMIPHSQVQATGQEWEWALWNPQTNEIKDPGDMDEE